MNELLQFFREFGNIINTALILSITGLVFWIFRATIIKKDAELALLRERIKAVETFSVDNVAEKFRALKEYYETHLKTWYQTSLDQLEEEKRRAIELKENELQLRVEEEIAKRTSIMKKYAEQEDIVFSTVRQPLRSQVCGTYSVVGHNPLGSEFSYFGELEIKEKGDVLLAKWEIGAIKQHHEGIGILVGNMLAFNFKYVDSNGNTSNGVVLYEVMTDEVMRGSWTGFGTLHVGFEECRKKS